MGALHTGHAALLRESVLRCKKTVLSIYVNPSQFGPSEDFSKYPRTLEDDLSLAADCGVSAVLIPDSEELYPITTWVHETELTKHLCGPHRPGHFQGVTTVVLKLFNIVGPSDAFFGLKDAQQFFVLSKMVKDLNLSVSMHGVPTVREADGLALSSRNRYLTKETRTKAPEIFKTLTALRRRLADEAADSVALKSILSDAVANLSRNDFRVQYLELCDLPSLSQANRFRNSGQVLAVAAFLDSTRLIDNLIW